MTKQELLERFMVERNSLLAIVNGLTPEQMTITLGEEGWTIGTHLHHLAYYDELYCRLDEACGRGENPVIPLLEEPRPDLVLVWAKKSLVEGRTEFARCSALMREHISSLASALFDQQAGNSGRTHAELLDSGAHYRIHREKISNGLRALTSAGGEKKN